MENRILLIANEIRFIDKFLAPSVDALRMLQAEVILSANVPLSQSRLVNNLSFLSNFNQNDNIKFIRTNIPRSPSRFGQILKSSYQLSRIINDFNVGLIHVHTPVASFIVRLLNLFVFKNKIKVIYSAHGFHFFKGSSLFSWSTYYLIEIFLSRFTNLIITTNQEDFSLAKKKFSCKVIKINGVGIENKEVQYNPQSQKNFHKIINFASVGELNKNKNHAIAINALSKISYSNWTYNIYGEGPNYSKLIALTRRLNLEKKVIFKGYSESISSELAFVDVFIHPSRREGLSVALMEAMQIVSICIASDIRGNRDLIDQDLGGILFSSNDLESLKSSIISSIEMVENGESFTEYNKSKLKSFSRSEVTKDLYNVYSEFLSINNQRTSLK